MKLDEPRRPASALGALLCASALMAGCKQHKLANDVEKAQGASAETIVGEASAVQRYGQGAGGGCKDVPDAGALHNLLVVAPTQGEVGGFAGGRSEWAAVVDREGRLCAIVVSTKDAAATWPGSKGIALAKAFTANAFSSDSTPMSTARLYTMSLPGHSLWGAANGDPLNARCLVAPSQSEPVGEFCGGVITFAGGLPLYKGQTRVGGLGLSGDTPCADHEIAKRIRRSAALDPAAGPLADDIVYSTVDGPSLYAHPLCANTWRNGTHYGDEAPGLPTGPAPTVAPSSSGAAG